MLHQVQKESFNSNSSEPTPSCYRSHRGSSAETRTSSTKMDDFQPSQYHLTVDEVDELVPEEWLDWDYGATAGMDLPEQQDTMQCGLPVSASPWRGLESKPNANNCPTAWSGFVPEPDFTWMDPLPCEDNIKIYAARPGESISDEVLFDQIAYSVSSESRVRPSQRKILSFASTSSNTSSELLEGFPELDSLPFSSATAQADDGTEKPVPSQILLEDSPSHLTTPPPSPSLQHDLPSRSKKRKAPIEDSRERDTASYEGHKSRILQLADHSVSEKRYRTKLNVVLATLRDKVPSLRVVAKRPQDYAYREGGCKLERPEASSKFDKATIVSKAVEYILYLETCNKRLSQEHVALKENIDAIQKITVSGLRRPE